MSDLVLDHGGWSATRYPGSGSGRTDEWGRETWAPEEPAAGWGTDDQAAGRHAINEDAVLTPIFHALTRGGWRRRQHEPPAAQRRDDPIDAFNRDPLTAPIPVQAPQRSSHPARRSTEGAHALAEVAAGRHHHNRERVAGLPWR